MSKQRRDDRDNLIKNLPDNLKHKPIEVKFKVHETEAKLPVDSIVKLDDDMVIVHIAPNSMFSGLIMGDRVLKVNGTSVGKDKQKAASFIAKGEEVSVEVSRRESIVPPTPERIKGINFAMRPGYAYFVVNVSKPKQMNAAATIGFSLKSIKRRLLITSIVPGTISSVFFALGDAIVDIDGNGIPFAAGDADMKFARSLIGRILTTGNATVMVERPVSMEALREFRRFFNSLEKANSDFVVAPDVLQIGIAAANMHSLIFRKVKPKSILSSDVRTRSSSNVNATTDHAKIIKVSTSSIETRITSDVDDEDDLKDVVRKSHAASSYDDD